MIVFYLAENHNTWAFGPFAQPGCHLVFSIPSQKQGEKETGKNKRVKEERLIVQVQHRTKRN
jgi:hypothetical protein